MIKIIITTALLLFSSTAFSAVELDADANGGVDIGKGGTNSTTAEGARTNLGVAPALGADDNYVTDAEKVVIGNTSGTNTGDLPAASQIEAETGTEASLMAFSVVRIWQAIAAYFAANVATVDAIIEDFMDSTTTAGARTAIGAQAATGAVYPSATSTSTGTGNINIDGVSADHYYFNNGASAATYTPVITSPPAANTERPVVLTVGGGAGVITMTWTNVRWMGTAGAATTTANKYSHYGCFIKSDGYAYCLVSREAADY